MAPIRHVFTSPQADVADPTLIRPSDWNQSHAATLLDAVSLAGNTAGVLANISSGTLILAGGNNVTLSQAGNAVTVSAAAAVAQSEQTQSRFNLTVGGNTSGALALISSGVMTLAGGNNVTLSQAGNVVTISGAVTVAQSVQTQNIVNVTLSGNTAGVLAHISSGTMTLAGGDNITLSQAGNAVTVIGAAGGTGGGGAPIATTVQSVASANSVGAVTRYAAEDHRHAGLYQISVGGNTAGATSAGAGSLVLAGGNNITLSGATAGGGMTLSVAAGAGGGGATLSRTIIPDYQFSGTVGAAIVVGSMSIQYVIVPQYVTANSAFAYGQVTVNTAANTSAAYFDYSLSVGIYTRVGSTLNSLSSGFGAEAISWSSNTTASVVGPRIFRCAMNVNMTPGEYHIMYNLSTNNTATGGANTTALGNTVSMYGASQIATGVSNIFNAAAFGQATHSTNDVYFGMGLYSVTTGVVPAVISLSGVNGSGTALQRANIIMDLENVT